MQEVVTKKKQLVEIIGKDECWDCGSKRVALRIPLQISRLDSNGNPIKWDTIGVPLEEYLYCPKCRVMTPIVNNRKGIPNDGYNVTQLTQRNPFGYL